MAKKEKVEQIEYDLDIRVIDIKNIETNEYNPNAMEQELFDVLVEAVKEGGMVQPILVRESKDKKDDFIVVDGEHRFLAARQAGLPSVAVVVVDYDEDMAKIRTISMNRVRGNYIPLKMAKLIADLQDRFSPTEIRRMTGIAKDEFKGLTELLEMPDIDFDNAPTVTSSDVQRPISISIMLMPDEVSPYNEAMTKAMGIAGPMVVPLVAEEVGEYDKAMTATMGILGVKLRNVGLATICRVFNKIEADEREKMIKAVSVVKED